MKTAKKEVNSLSDSKDTRHSNAECLSRVDFYSKHNSFTEIDTMMMKLYAFVNYLPNKKFSFFIYNLIFQDDWSNLGLNSDTKFGTGQFNKYSKRFLLNH